MKTLSYSPSCEAYVEVRKKGSPSYHDISEDIVSMQVTRQGMGSSNFSLTLQNEGWKYNGFFTPMDKIVLYCTKISRVKLFSGFITDCDVFSLYQKDFHLSGKCSIYKLEQYYWDPHLDASMLLLFENRSTNSEWAGYSQLITDLLVKVGNWPSESIAIGEVPADAISFAQEMYRANMDSAQQLYDRTNEFFQVLQTHGPKGVVAGGVVTTTGETATIGTVTIDGNAIKSLNDLPPEVLQEIKKVSQQRQTVVGRAVQQLGKEYVWGAVGPDTFDCSGLVGYCLTGEYERIGTTHTFMGWEQISNPKPGDVAVNDGHTGLYIGGGNMIHASCPGVGVIVGPVQDGMIYVKYSGIGD